MSVDLQIIPIERCAVEISKLIDYIPRQLGRISFYKIDEERMTIATGVLEHDCSYQVTTGELGHVFVFVKRISIDDLDYEKDIVNDYGRNIMEHKRDFIVNSWKTLRYYFMVSSYPGRTLDEMEVQKRVAAEIASLTSGYVVQEYDDVYSIPVGLYTGREFSECDVVPIL